MSALFVVSERFLHVYAAVTACSLSALLKYMQQNTQPFPGPLAVTVSQRIITTPRHDLAQAVQAVAGTQQRSLTSFVTQVQMSLSLDERSRQDAVSALVSVCESLSQPQAPQSMEGVLHAGEVSLAERRTLQLNAALSALLAE